MEAAQERCRKSRSVAMQGMTGRIEGNVIEDNRRKYCMVPRWVGDLLLILILCLGSGCAATTPRYTETHEVKNLTIIFLDDESLRLRWREVAGRDAVRFTSQMNSAAPVIKTVRGFYNFATNTLYCPKWNFEVCGHELHHAVLGQFHAQD